ncbi:hypothetical protein K7395_03955 [Streptomyces filamentosus]|uniref:Secreted protein n=1 Tax=Streptomyces filamentosus TaxID=67294 RepID=A0ABY4UP19_STRFL|nr:hypothetical protein [Streptomyces filamentosus]USC45940.1 hypothetical protein K7395_03955 [Streptomyces filamentosus]
MLATLLLTVLTLVGGAATANGAAPAALATRSLAPAATVAAAPPPAAPRTHDSALASRHRPGHESALASRHRTGHDGAPDSRHHHTGHGTAHDVRHLVAQAGHELPRAAADPAQAPRAGTGRAYLLLHAPPPPHDALTPAPAGPAEPRGGVHRVAAESFDAPGSRRGALPGVRGPPGRTTGPTTGHPPSCSGRSAPSADQASRPR